MSLKSWRLGNGLSAMRFCSSRDRSSQPSETVAIDVFATRVWRCAFSTVRSLLCCLLSFCFISLFPSRLFGLLHSPSARNSMYVQHSWNSAHLRWAITLALGSRLCRGKESEIPESRRFEFFNSDGQAFVSYRPKVSKGRASSPPLDKILRRLSSPSPFLSPSSSPSALDDCHIKNLFSTG